MTSRIRSLDEQLSDDNIAKINTMILEKSEEYVKAKARLKALEEMTKTIHAFSFSSLPAELPQGQKNILAFQTDDYKEHLRDIDVARLDLLRVEQRIKNGERMIEMWRTHSSNHRRAV